ncbi:hypothetical protein [Mesorhizobium humile]|uniref:Uncharacterized protein n=1 Tax=Mesorhizobium humile TaxID=3072313 RepID=A0ABU4YIK0_9HYPH|nr:MULTISPECIES: hypothetical protein [unclassified Mesorhizobium]MDX8457544.1 hypothetical protein [Mesorhizobium sp. VK2D]MDX8485647.1 hypothetical protein [Mesorhizobium sp. VK2B]
MQIAAQLLAALGDSIEAIKAHLSGMDGSTLERLLETVPRTSPVGSAEMVMIILLYREIERRQTEDRNYH